MIAKRLGKSTIGFDAATKKSLDAQDVNFLLSKVESEDLVSFGMIPEFVGRFNSIANCNELTTEDLVEILVKPKNAIIKQYTALFAEENVKIDFTETALQAMAKKAKDTGTGARALRVIAENILRDLMFEVPSDPSIREIVIDEGCITGIHPPKIIRDRTA